MNKPCKKTIQWLSGVSVVLGLCISTSVQYSALHDQYVTQKELKITLLEREIQFLKILDNRESKD